MLYRFKSKNMGDVIMLESIGRRMLEIIGKTPSPKGIIQSEEMPAAVKALEAAIALEESGEDDPGIVPEGVGLHQRAKPFIDMLQWNHKVGEDVVWGV
ncbi:SSU ribosomal protein S5p (S2e) [Polaromonas sp. CG9_12]|uniref:DUF1840 domain-containing protein n=1 Tax=Polaromonas sp. CG_9.11 TaxID=2787730 RepID=UPI0004DDCA32|nr:DUF1840 domain-containing protein [Polaromonas sp. CG_9.11]MBG6077078.1 hypothetical protein [Polaromonas sp. CG_9.11]CDS53449.1 SSU ribosomal protein S5p (S2e) [Polaromonas sp. CG9_12]